MSEMTEEKEPAVAPEQEPAQVKVASFEFDQNTGDLTIRLSLPQMGVHTARGYLLQMDDQVKAWYFEQSKLAAAAKTRIVKAGAWQKMKNFVATKGR